ncbi:hypothetical protein ACOSP7_031084 [Xanthoceras sorbifolium]
MEGVFVFAAKPTLASSDELKEKPPDTLSHSKRCRVDCGERDEGWLLIMMIWLRMAEADCVLPPVQEEAYGPWMTVSSNRKHSGAGAGAEAKLGSRPSGGSFIGSDVGTSSSGSKVGVDFCGGKAGSWASGGKAGIESNGGKAGVVSSGGKTGLTSGSDWVGFVSNCVRMRSRFAVLDEEVMESIEVAREVQNSKVAVAQIDTPLSDISNTSGMCKNVSSGKKEAKSKGKDKVKEAAGYTMVDVIEENDTLKLLHHSMLDSSISNRMVLGYEDSCIDSPQQTSKSCSSVDRQVMVGPSGSGDGL